MMRYIHVLATLGLAALITACESGSSEGPAPISFSPAPQPTGTGFVALYAPPVQAVPYPNDIYRGSQTLNVPVKVTTPLAAALNTLDGFSTTAHISVPFNAPINLATVTPSSPPPPPPAPVAGLGTLIIVNTTTFVPLVPGVDYAFHLSTAAGADGTILEIQPLRPLEPNTTYAFILTTGVRSTANVAVAPDLIFRTVRDAHLAGVMTGNPGLDALLPAIGPLINLAVALGIPGNTVAVAWSVSTQSTSNVLDSLNQTTTARGSTLAPMGITTANLGLGLPGLASLYTGALDIVYYGNPTPANLLTSVWVNSSFVPPTRANPAPLPQGGPRRIPVLASLPAGATKPTAGWPIVVIQHGVTVNRTVMIAMADAFAGQGFGVVAIDLPLHGVTDINSPFYHQPGNPLGTTELHFNADNVGPLGDYRPDGLIDNGWQIFNLRNPLNARDHGRQAVVDLIQLFRTLPSMDFSGDGVADVDPNRLHFVSLSLGSIFSTALLALDLNANPANPDLVTATMSSPGGRFIDFLYDPMAIDFGLPIRRAIEAQGLAFGSLAFDNFARDLQTILDPIEPLNYAAAAALNHPIHVVEVLSDTAVPATLTENVARLMGLTSVHVPGTASPSGVRGIVRFTAGVHSSMFNPVDLSVTTEMQTEAVVFALSGGTQLPVTNAAVVQ
jgi:hypothetical protein